jgi:signal transduction histidine kinase
MMDVHVRKATIPARRAVLLGVADVGVTLQLTQLMVHHAKKSPISIASNLRQLREMFDRTAPAVILLDGDIVAGEKELAESLSFFTKGAPVVLLAPDQRCREISQFVAEGHVEFVSRTGDFVPLAASLIERRLRWIEASEMSLGPPWAEFPANLGEIFRHEINNPLTGILGNAELLLGHPDHLSATETQRLQTVVDLAVRLRETIRRLSNAWERQPQSVNSD